MCICACKLSVVDIKLKFVAAQVVSHWETGVDIYPSET